MILGLWLTLAHAQVACSEDPVSDAEASIEDLYVRYAALDEAGFDRASKHLDAATSCLKAPPPSATVARVHQANALIAYFAGQRGAARRAMIAARLHDPAWKLDPAEFAEGHPFHDLWVGAIDAGPMSVLREVDGKTWIVDGAERREVPIERAFLFQVEQGGEIASTHYLFDLEDLPDFGQNAEVPPWASPRRVAASVHGLVRSLSSTQQATGIGVTPQSGGALGFGGAGVLRVTPIAFAGLEAGASTATLSDAVLLGTLNTTVHAVALVGGAFAVGEQQAFAAARLGYATDDGIFWVQSATGLEQNFRASGGPSLGGEVGVRGENLDARLHVDQRLSGGAAYETRVGIGGGYRVTGPLAAEGGLETYLRGWDLYGSSGEVVGSRSDTALRIRLGVGLWF